MTNYSLPLSKFRAKRLWRVQMAPIVFIGVFSLVLTACSDSHISGDVQNFNTAASVVSKPVADFYTKANTLHRALYLAEAQRTPSEPLSATFPVADSATVQKTLSEIKGGDVCAALKDAKKLVSDNQAFYELDADELTGASGNPSFYLRTGMTQYFSEDYVKARLSALDAISTYAGKLNALATSTAPTQAQTAIQAMGTNLSSLSDSIAKLDDKHSKALQAKEFSTPIANLAALAANWALKWRRDVWVKQSLYCASSELCDLCTALEDDITRDYGKLEARIQNNVVVEESRINKHNAPASEKSVDTTINTTTYSDLAKAGEDFDTLASVDPRLQIHSLHLAVEKLKADLAGYKCDCAKLIKAGSKK